jgi:hypothetical protein
MLEIIDFVDFLIPKHMRFEIFLLEIATFSWLGNKNKGGLC